MRLALTLVLMLFSADAPFADEAEADAPPLSERIILSTEDVDLQEFLWENRLVVVFADSPNDPNFIQQMEYIEADLENLASRDVIVLTDTTPGEQGALRQKLRPRGFMLVLIGKDGTIYLRKPLSWDVREITRSIDKTPMRQRELREQGSNES